MQSFLKQSFSTQLNIIPKALFSAYDLAILGGGPGGYVAALKAAQCGLKTCCIEKEAIYGGTCLREGCIPSKTLLNISHKYEDAKKHYGEYGLKVKGIDYDWEKIQKNRVNVFTGLGKGIEILFKKNGVTPIKGFGTLESENSIKVKLTAGGEQLVEAKNIILATGSEANPFPGLPYDEKVILSSTGALALKKVPKKMVVIGAGVIGLELGSVYRRMGAEVTVIEYLDRICPGSDLEVSKALLKSLKAQGLKIVTGAKVTSGKKNDKGIVINYEPVKKKKNSKQQSIQVDCVLIATGRRAFSKGSGIEKLGIKQNKWGQVEINDKFQTNIPNIFAIGDLVRGAMLAHKAEEEGCCVIDYLKTGHFHINYDAIPSIIYTHPELAGVGKTEEDMKAAKKKFKKSSFPMVANSRAKSQMDADGLIKIIADEKNTIIGVHMCMSDAGEMIHEGCVAVHHKLTSEQLTEVCHGHPTLSEAVKEAALGIHFKALHC